MRFLHKKHANKEPQSKRKSTRLQEGIKKKIAAHNRKQKKLDKKDVTWKSRKPKDPGIPNSFPYKGQILAEMEEAKRREAEERALRREQQREAARAAGQTEEEIEESIAREEAVDNSNRLAALLESASAAAAEYDGNDDTMDVDDDDSDNEIVIGAEEGVSNVKDLSRKAYDKIYKKVVELSDVVLYVLDARDPEGTRSKDVEHHILANPDKRLIFVLNKIDLVPEEALKTWKTHLERNFPVVPLAASTAAHNAQTFPHPGLTPARTATFLLQALKRFAGQAQKKRSISVGIVGYPNVGKSSVINALTARHGNAGKACPVGALAGVTTSIRKVKIDNKLSVWDSPGIVFPSEKNNVDEVSRLILLNALPPKQIEDPVPAVSLLLKRLLKSEDLFSRLRNTYDIPPIVTIPHDKFVTEFLVHVSRKMGRLGRGGVPDLRSAGMAVLNDWRDGRIAGWAMPKSKAAEKKEEDASRPVIVTQWAEEFKLDGLWDGETMEE